MGSAVPTDIIAGMDRDIITTLVRQQIDDLWGRGRVGLVEQNYSTDIVDHMPVPGQPTGRDALADVVRDFRTLIPDLTMALHGTIACGDRGCDWWTLTGTHAPTGRRVRFSGIDMVRVADGRIAELWHVEEMLQFADQIGAAQTDFGAPTAPVPPGSIEAAADPGANAHVPPDQCLTPLERRNLGIARDHIETIWARGDMSSAYRLYAPDVVDHQPAPGQRPGIDGIVDVLGWLREAVPDLTMAIADYVVEGDLAADRWVMRGTHSGAPLMGIPAAGRPFEINGMDVIRIRDDGLISDVWHVEEFARLKAQISQ